MENSNLSRGQFLKQLGLSSGALMAFYCLGTVTACTKADEPAPTTSNTNTNTNTNTTPAKIDFTLDLTSVDYKKLKTEGEYVYKDSIIVANVKGGTYVALAKGCTHEGTTVQYQFAQNNFHCANHGSDFDTNGKAIKGPAVNALKIYSTELKGDNLRVFEA